MPDKIGRCYTVQTSEFFDGNAFVVEEHVESRRPSSTRFGTSGRPTTASFRRPGARGVPLSTPRLFLARPGFDPKSVGDEHFGLLLV
jgi:hypothetical protein